MRRDEKSRNRDPFRCIGGLVQGATGQVSGIVKPAVIG